MDIDGNIPYTLRVPDNSAVYLTDTERKGLSEILTRRANEVASFKKDLETKFNEVSGKILRLYELPGSVELALSREIARLRRMADKVALPPAPEQDGE
jgi:hypothetical protein